MSAAFFVVLGFTIGGWLADILWKMKIRDKAESGHRLECQGKLYNVTEDQPGNSTGQP